MSLPLLQDLNTADAAQDYAAASRCFSAASQQYLSQYAAALQQQPPSTIVVTPDVIMHPNELSMSSDANDLSFPSTDPLIAEGEQKCPYCTKVFFGLHWKQKRERHIKIHSGIKPFQCPYCNHKSNRKDNLRSHIMSMHGAKVVPQLPQNLQ